MINQVSQALRPTKKQRELLLFIEEFIAQYGYSPSYREIMAGLDYNSVATVALHINNLIARGHLLKRDHSARSLEVVQQSQQPSTIKSNEIKPSEEKWLIEKVEHYVSELESQKQVPSNSIDELYVLIGSLRVLGLEGAAQSFIPRLSELKKRMIQ